ncbi:MAG: hypothetical protein FD156_924 [Nitrospirae bacterium]|nr:MAG: hypothetical protein FD156_924 [Nitrospirota bacterium]
MKTLQKIRQKVIEKDYYLSDHAEEEMLDDELERVDIENAILKGRIEKKLTEDIRGTRYIKLKALQEMVEIFMLYAGLKSMAILFL